MSIEEAEYILNEAVISEPSIKSYTYISAEEINNAISRVLEENENEKNKIKELEYEIAIDKKTIQELTKKENIDREKNTPIILGNIYLTKLFNYLKKVVKPLFLLNRKNRRFSYSTKCYNRYCL